ncbi:hypothetical protein AB0E83_00285 [Streptomyces sp. NPDC035033]|uniref:hypothetical protein n=1 Tax=Streptomyces sp. NPDC035033 TaxID=3155368 RepID=UPI0033F8A435
MRLPSGPPADGVPGWRAADATAWAAAGPGRWARPLWPFLGLLVTVFAAIATEPVPVCSDASPCGPDWVGMVQTGLALGLLHWTVRLPELTLLAAPALAVMVATDQFPAPTAASGAANAAVLAVLALAWASACARLAARRRQRLLFVRASGAVTRPMNPADLPRRGTRPLTAGLLLCAVAAATTLLGLDGVHEDEERAARATRVEAEVTSRTETSLRLRGPEGRRFSVEALFPEDHRVGATVTVLEDGTWRRLVAEPYDPFGRQLLALAAGLPGISLACTGLRTHRRFLVMRREELPAVRVLKATDGEGTARIHAADDTDLSAPLAVFTWASLVFPHAFPHDGAEDGGPEGDDGDDGDEGEDPDGDDEFTLVSLQEVVMLGVPYEGAVPAFVVPTSGGIPGTVVGTARLHLPWKGPRVSGRAR